MSIGQKFLYKGEEYTVTHDGTVTGQFCQELLAEITRLKAEIERLRTEISNLNLRHMEMTVEIEQLKTLLHNLIEAADHDSQDSGWYSEQSIKALEEGRRALEQARKGHAPTGTK